MEPRLVQQQSQKLILSPQIRQYLRLLQMPVTDLAQAVETELAENPLLEEKPEGGEDGLDQSLPPPEDPRNSEELRIGDSYEKLNDLSEEFPDYPSFDYAGRSVPDLQKNKNFQESLITRTEALSDYLLWQIRFLDLNPAELAVAEEIIGNIDEQGYLQADVKEIAASCKTVEGLVEEVLKRIQELEPPGIGARNLQEALLLQLRRQNPVHTLAVEIVQNHLGRLEKRDWQQIAKILNVPLEEIKRAADVIIRLEPRPGRSFYAEEPIAVTPDAVIAAEETGPGYRVDITHEKIPELRVNAYYRRLLRDKNLDGKTRDFVKTKLQDALDFMKAIKQRRSTLREITEEIIREQHEFFEKGFSHLKPLRLKDIAQNLGIHESTVSRAIQGKYVQTPQGTIPYKNFFSSKLETVSGPAESQRSIMTKIKAMVENENPERPLSDQDIVGRLKSEGIMIARRTVAKYRDLLKILPSHLRRKR